MNIVIAERAMKAMADLTPALRKAFHKQLAFLEQNIQHPYWRFYFLIRHEVYLITGIVPHPK